MNKNITRELTPEEMVKSEIRSDLINMLDKYKGRVCAEFEKVCPNDVSLRRMVKEMHDIFQDMKEEIEVKYNIYGGIE